MLQNKIEFVTDYATSGTLGMGGGGDPHVCLGQIHHHLREWCSCVQCIWIQPHHGNISHILAMFRASWTNL